MLSGNINEDDVIIVKNLVKVAARQSSCHKDTLDLQMGGDKGNTIIESSLSLAESDPLIFSGPISD